MGLGRCLPPSCVATLHSFVRASTWGNCRAAHLSVMELPIPTDGRGLPLGNYIYFHNVTSASGVEGIFFFQGLGGYLGK